MTTSDFGGGIIVGDGINLENSVPASTTNTLYNDAGTLKFNGSAVGGSSYTAGSGLTLVGTEFNTAGTGNFDQLLFTDENLKIGTDSYSISSGISIGYQAGYNSTPSYYEVNIPLISEYDFGYNANLVAIGNKVARGSSFANSTLIGYAVGADSYCYTSGSAADGYILNSGFIGVIALGDAAFSGAYFQKTNGLSVTDYIAIGRESCALTTNCETLIGIGSYACKDSIELEDSIAIGSFSLRYGSGNYNIAIGQGSSQSCSGNYNIGIGYNCNFGVVGNNNIDIKAAVGNSFIGTNSNKLHIQNTIVGDTSSKLLAIGNVGSADLTPDATLEIKPKIATDVGLIVQAAFSHSASLQEWQNSSETKLLAVGPDGGVELPSNVPSTTTNKLYNDGGTLKFNGSAVGGSSYTAGSGLTLVGTEFNTAGTGNFNEIRFSTSNSSVLISANSSIPSYNNYSTTMGLSAGASSSGIYNTQIGLGAGSNINGDYNTFIGVSAGNKYSGSQQTRNYSTAVGFNALSMGFYNVQAANYFSVLGYEAGHIASGNRSVGIGYRSLYFALGDDNIEIVNDGTNSPLSYNNNGNLTSQNNKLHIGYTILGDTSDKKLAIGNVSFSNIDPDATLEILPKAATDVGLIVQAATSHSASLQEWQNSSETKLLAVGPDGGLEIPSNVPSTTTNKFYNNGGTLYFNGSAVNTDTNTTYTAGTGLSLSSTTFNLDFSSSAIVTEVEGISSNDNDTTLPTSAAVKDYVDNNAGASYTAGSGLTLVGTEFNVYGGSGHFINLDVDGAFTAVTKSFLIDHPSKEGMKLQYASLEGPENGVYVRGTTKETFITLPNYWQDLVHNSSITVTLTSVGSFQPLFVESKSNREIIVGGVCGYYDYVVYGERKDVAKLEVEW